MDIVHCQDIFGFILFHLLKIDQTMETRPKETWLKQFSNQYLSTKEFPYQLIIFYKETS